MDGLVALFAVGESRHANKGRIRTRIIDICNATRKPRVSPDCRPLIGKAIDPTILPEHALTAQQSIDLQPVPAFPSPLHARLA